MAVDRDRLRRWRALRRHAGAPGPATTICRYRPASGGYSRRLQGRPLDPVLDGFRKDGRAVRPPRRHLRREREVIGERVRDKIAASKKKGMWMGGVTPLGYAIKDRKLVIVREEAETVRQIFRRYRELGSVRLLKQDLDKQGIRSKQRTYGNGSRAGGQPFSRGALYALLSNPVYIGEIAHKGARYPGQHEAILDRETWDSVQDQLRDAAPEQRGRVTGPRSPLIGKLFDEAGHRLTPSHATKAGRRYRYYVSRPLVTETAKQHPGAWRIPATRLEHLIATEAATMLGEPSAIAAVLENAGLEPENVPAALAMADRFRHDLEYDAARAEALAAVVQRVELSPIRQRVILSAAVLFFLST